MPYITKENREKFDIQINELVMALRETHEGLTVDDGEVNYVIFRLLKLAYTEIPSYAKLSRALGVLTAITLEFYERFVKLYEIRKRIENGDVE